MRVTWIQPEDLIRHELVQSAAEGRDVSRYAETWVAAGGELGAPARGASAVPATAAQRALALELLDELDATACVPAPDEPDDLDAIKRTWREPPALPTVSAKALAERIRGAWLGRAAGCVLGKPVEGMGRAGIRAVLEATGRWPLSDWFTAQGLPADVAERHPWNKASRATSLAERIDGTPEDDDLNYTMLALLLMERHGDAFTTDDLATLWLSELPGLRVFTAERAVYRSLLEGVAPEAAARVRNPYREWIGAQIRADLYGWVRPGDPRGAAELAWRDARLSHTRNGLYGAMFVAATAAAACATDDVWTALAAGRSVVPPASRLASAIDEAMDLARRGVPLEAAVDLLYAAHAGLHWVHAVNNTAAVVLALGASGGDFTRAICAAVQAGWDTDSNGATVGGVAGALRGASGIPPRWTVPLRDRVATSLRGFDGCRITELVARTAALARLS